MGTALILAWSITLSNFSTQPQVINLGPAPTQNNYQITTFVVRNINNPTVSAFVSLGSNPENPCDILCSWPIGGSGIYNNTVMNLSTGSKKSNGSLALSAGQDLYLKYWDDSAVPGESVTLDILAYEIPTTQSGN